MTISSSDIIIVASERMTDNLSAVVGVGGGGKRGTAIVTTATENNVFPDVTASDRVIGRVQARLVYPSVISSDRDSLMSTHAAVMERPSDANVHVCALSEAHVATLTSGFPELASVRALYGLQQYSPGGAQSLPSPPLSILSAISGTTFDSNAVYQVGDKVDFGTLGSPQQVTTRWKTILTVSLGGGSPPYSNRYTVASGVPGGSAGSSGSPLVPNVLISAPAVTTASLSAAGTSIAVDRLEQQVIPVGLTAGSAVAAGLYNSALLADWSGKVAMFCAGQMVLIRHPGTPGTYEVALISRVDYHNSVIHFAAGVANAYASGAVIAQCLPLGDLQANFPISKFSQQTWTRTWGSTAIGSPITPIYSGDITLTNIGAATDRWAIVFRTDSAFDCISERFGMVASGTKGSNFSPVNPLTNQPYFTLLSANWATTIVPGSTLRFDTAAAAAPVWLTRTVSPSAAGGTTQAALYIRGDINA